jgi:hypothetical protein
MEANGQHQAPAAWLPGNDPSTQWLGGWMSPRDSLNDLEKRKISYTYHDWNPGWSALSPVTILATLWCFTSNSILNILTATHLLTIFNLRGTKNRQARDILHFLKMSTYTHCVGLTTLPPSCADCLEIWKPQLPAALRACPGIALPFTYRHFYANYTVYILPYYDSLTSNVSLAMSLAESLMSPWPSVLIGICRWLIKWH